MIVFALSVSDGYDPSWSKTHPGLGTQKLTDPAMYTSTDLFADLFAIFEDYKQVQRFGYTF